MALTPHKEKLDAAILNPKCGNEDRDLLRQAVDYYNQWIDSTKALTSEGAERVRV